jgi:folate-dependent phosphoribosylglycinamide formyltransferase PurN
MKIVIIAREEPVFMGPFLIKLMEARRNEIKLLALGSLREAGPKPKSFWANLERLYAYWLLFEPRGFARVLLTRLWWYILRGLGPLGESFDRFSLDRAAKKLGIPLVRIKNPNDEGFLNKLKAIEPDLIFNQSDYMMKSELLKIPQSGVVNRHGSLLPKHRGRVASFWSHLEGKYGVTIHFVDEGIDSGSIILQSELQIDPCSCYFRVLKSVFEASYAIANEAFNQLEAGTVNLMPNKIEEGSIHRFPTIAELKEYRKIIMERREEG